MQTCLAVLLEIDLKFVCPFMDVTVCLPDLFEIDLKFVIVRQIYEPNSEDRKSREFNVTVM